MKSAVRDRQQHRGAFVRLITGKVLSDKDKRRAANFEALYPEICTKARAALKAELIAKREKVAAIDKQLAAEIAKL